MTSVKRTFSIPDDLSEDLDAAVPKSRRSKFVARALREALKEESRLALLELLETLEPMPSETGATEALRRFRMERAKLASERTTP